IAVSDGSSMGHEGIRASLVWREVIADSFETVMHAERQDGMVTYAGCDKFQPCIVLATARLNVASVFLYSVSPLPGTYDCRDNSLPDMVMAAARLDVASVFLYGGSILPGHHNGRDITIQNVFEAVGARGRDQIDDAELDAIERAACPSEGSCGGMFTANTMA